MKLRKIMLACVAAVLLLGTTMSAFAEETEGNVADYVNALVEGGQAELILDVESYRAADPDLAKQFGDDWNAYLVHFLTVGLYEGRTEGVRMNPLLYAAAYSDVKEACGEDILAIVDHYLTVGIAEKRTTGSENGTAAQEAKAKKATAGIKSRKSTRTTNTVENTPSEPVSAPQPAEVPVTTTATEVPAAAPVAAVAPVAEPVAPAAPQPAEVPAAVAPEAAQQPVEQHPVEQHPVEQQPVEQQPAQQPVEAAASANANPKQDEGHTTSIYGDNDQLIRVEYYDADQNLSKYSDVTNYDASTNSYTEDVYSYDSENDVEIHERTDTYINGELASSETY